LPAKSLARAVRGALEKVPLMPEWQDAAFLKREGFAAFGEALLAARCAAHEAGLSPKPLCGGGWPMMSCWPIKWR